VEFQAIKTDRLYVKVAEQVSGLITDGHILPGNRLPSERVLAEKLNVSRPTVREAMIALELAKIVEIRTGSGIYVTEQQPSLSKLDKGVGPFELLDTRLVIESLSCELAAKNITDAQIAELKATIEEMKLTEESPDDSEKTDGKFHNIIAQASGNSAITYVVKWLWELRTHSDLSKAFTATLISEGIHPSIEDHIAIVKALEERDPEKSKAAMQEHINNAITSVVSFIENNSLEY